MPYTAIHVRALLDAMRRLGVDASAVLSSLGLSGDWPDAGQGLDGSGFEQLLLACLRVSRDPALGLRVGEQASLVALGLSDMSSPKASSLHAAIETFVARYGVAVDPEAPTFASDAEQARLSFPMPQGDEATVRMRVEMGLTLSLLLLRAWAGPFLSPTEVRLPYAEPDYGDQYRRVFGPVLRFGQAEASIAFPAEVLAAPPYPWGRQLVRPSSTRFSVAMSPARVGERVRKFLVSYKAKERPDMAEIAANMGMTERTLRRRLSAEGVRFRELLDDAQRERALHLALDASHSPETASDALGFSEVSAFYRAFKRWTGFTPIQYRTMHLRDNDQSEPSSSSREADSTQVVITRGNSSSASCA